jgi:hypothetical protein
MMYQKKVGSMKDCSQRKGRLLEGLLPVDPLPSWLDASADEGSHVVGSL